MYRLSKTKFVALCISIILFLYSFLVEELLKNTSSIEDLIRTGMIVLILPCFVFLTMFAYKIEKRIGFILIFILLGFFFYYGQYSLIALGYYDELSRLYVSLVCGKIDFAYVISAFYVFIRSLLVLFAGYLIVTNDIADVVLPNIEDDGEQIRIPTGFYSVALVFFVVSLICAFVQIGYELTLGSYINIRSIEAEVFRFSSGGILFYVAYFAKWFLPSSYMLLLYHAIKGNREKYRIVILILLLYSVLYIGTGARFQLLKIITAVFLIHNYFVRPFSKKDLRWAIPTTIIGMLAMSAISGVRGSSISMGGVFDFLKLLSPERAFYNIFNETGITSISLANTMKYCPSQISHLYFTSILKTIAMVLPSFINPWASLSNTTTSNIFSHLLYGFKTTGYGSSFVTEVYYYWGSYLYIVVFIYGLIVAKLNNSFRQIRSYKSIGKIYLTIYMLSEMIYCIRNDVYDLPRGLIYYVLIPLLLVRIIDDTARKKIHRGVNK